MANPSNTSALRTALRARLTTAMRERDRATVATLRSAVAALENAEAVPVDELRAGGAGGAGALGASSEHVAGAAIGVGAAEAERLVLDDDAESAIVRAEVATLHEAAEAYEAAGHADRAAEARISAATLTEVVHSVLGTTWG